MTTQTPAHIVYFLTNETNVFYTPIAWLRKFAGAPNAENLAAFVAKLENVNDITVTLAEIRENNATAYAVAEYRA